MILSRLSLILAAIFGKRYKSHLHFWGYCIVDDIENCEGSEE